MARKFTHLAKAARERYQQSKDLDMSILGVQNSTVTAPPMAKKAKYLRDADGNIYLWTLELAERGDLVAAYDPNEPDRYEKDQAQIALNRELEIARERADAEEAARLEALRDKEAAEAAQKEAQEVAQANERNLRKAEEELQAEREAHAKAMAEMQAKLDAMAKEIAGDTPEPKKVAPKKRAKKVEEPTGEPESGSNPNSDLDEFDN